MTPNDLNSFFTPEELRAFSAMWADQGAASKQQVREIMDLFAAPESHKAEIRIFLFKLLRGLLSGTPEYGAWMQAVAVGSFQLRPEQKYAMPGLDDRAARFISRGRSTLDEGVTSAQRQLGITDETVLNGMNLTLLSSIAKEFRNLALARVALGTAWPLAAAVDKYLTNEEHRQLYQFGESEELQAQLAVAVKTTLQAFLHVAFPEGPPKGSRAAHHERQLPNGVDLHAHFTREQTAVLRYRSKILSALGLSFHDAPSGCVNELAACDLDLIKSSLNQAELSLSYIDVVDREPAAPHYRSQQDIARLKSMFPLLTKTNCYNQLVVAAARAYSRAQNVGTSSLSENIVHVKVRQWVRRGSPPPHDIRIDHAHIFEEEAALLFMQGENDLLKPWRDLGFFPGECPVFDEVPDFEHLISRVWREPGG